MNSSTIEIIHVPVDKEKANKKPASSGIFMTGVNLTNVIIGSGILTLPVSFANGGFGFSIILLVCSAIIAHFSIICIVKLLTVTGRKTLPDALFATTGIAGFIALSICQIMNPILAVLSYSIITADNFTQIFAYLVPSVSALQDRKVILGISIYGIVFPLSLFKNVSFLDKMSLLSIAGVVFYFFSVIIRTTTTPNIIYPKTGSFSFIKSGVAQALSVLCFAFTCQHVVPSIYRAQKEKSVARMIKSTHITICFSVTVYIIIAICGYISFGGSLNGNMLIDFCNSDVLITVARITFACTVILSSPLHIVAAREGIVTIVQKFINVNRIAHIFITLALVSIAYGVATQTSDLGVVVAVTGALTGAPLGYILPGLAFIIGMRSGFVPNKASKILAYFMIVFGAGLSILGLVMSLRESGSVGLRVKYWCTSDVDKKVITLANITQYNNVWGT